MTNHDANERELVVLSVGNRVTGFKEGARERLLVREDLETASFEHVAKFDDRRINCEEFEIVRRVPRLGGRGSAAEKTERLRTAVDDLVDRTRDGLGARVGVDL